MTQDPRSKALAILEQLDPGAPSRVADSLDALSGAGMADLTALGIEPVALGETDATTPHAASQRFFAVWRAPDENAVEALVAAIAGSGWHDDFETINAAGTGCDIPAHLGQPAAA